MEKEISFTYAPSRGKGILFLFSVCGILAFLEWFLVWRFGTFQVGPQLFLLLIAMLIFAVPLVFLLYRLYSLLFSYYRLERDGLHIQWGLRTEVIPLNAIEWIRSPMEMTEDVPWSVLPMPGAYLGTVEVSEHLSYEFLASDMGKMLFLGTSRYIYAISPNDPAGFMAGFERILQMGALTNVNWTTTRPGNWLLEAWRNKTGRISAILSLLFLLLLYILAGIRFNESNIEMSENSVGNLLTIRSLSLPIFATIIWLIGTLIGLWIFQQKSCRRIAELIWGAAAAAVFQFLIAGLLPLT